MKKVVLLALATILVIAVLGFAQESVWPTGRLEILGPWGGVEQEALFKVLEPFEAATGIKIDYVGSRDWATVFARAKAGNAPDMFISPVPAVTKEFARAGYLVPLDSFMNMSQMEKSFSADWRKLGTVDGHLYGIFGPVTIKSLIWYDPEEFADNGYQVPTTWDELVVLTKQISDEGNIPWSIAMGCGDATGWPGTDWIEDIMLRTVGREVYDQWVNHEIPWTDPRVKHAWEVFGSIALNEKYVFGGTQGELSAFFGDGADPLFTGPPGAYMHRMALFMWGYIRDHFPNSVPGKTVDFFEFPPVDPQYGNPALVAGEMLIMMRDTPESRAFTRYWASAGAQGLIAAGFGRLSSNRDVDPYFYSDPILNRGSQLLGQSSTVRFDGSDLMPSEIGVGIFWTGVIDYLSGGNLDSILNDIEEVAQEVY